MEESPCGKSWEFHWALPDPTIILKESDKRMRIYGFSIRNLGCLAPAMTSMSCRELYSKGLLHLCKTDGPEGKRDLNLRCVQKPREMILRGLSGRCKLALLLSLDLLGLGTKWHG
jgi:hypothetical protein